MTAAGLPAAGVTVFAALALTGTPAAAQAGAHAGRPAVMASPCADSARTACADGYGSTAAPTGTVAPAGTATAPGMPGATTTLHTRGHGGYGSVSPSTTPTTPATPAPSSSTPTANTDTVPPGVGPSSVSPSSASPGPAQTTPGGGVSAGSALPVTGAPMGAMISLGTLMVAAGAASVWYTRRRRSA
jgi:hypothetical protein